MGKLPREKPLFDPFSKGAGLVLTLVGDKMKYTKNERYISKIVILVNGLERIRSVESYPNHGVVCFTSFKPNNARLYHMTT